MPSQKNRAESEILISLGDFLSRKTRLDNKQKREICNSLYLPHNDPKVGILYICAHILKCSSYNSDNEPITLYWTYLADTISSDGDETLNPTRDLVVTSNLTAEIIRREKILSFKLSRRGQYELQRYQL